MAGRPPKTAAQHKIDGTFRNTRHKKRAEQSFRAGVPTMPEGMSNDAEAMWLMIVDQVPHEVLCTLDVYALQDCCQWYALSRAYHRQLQRDPIDKDILKAASIASQKLLAYSSRFGLTPTDRARIKAPPPTDEELDPIAAVLKMTQAG